ncbi:IS4 family transposase [Pseudomonas aeruginosa]|jgi:hypothetical protein|nr:IS4 family transposase [Pseudomonas aeruginosa]
MSLPNLRDLFSDIAARIQSPEFVASARHPDHPCAFTRHRKLPLVSLVVLMISGMRKSIQAELDEFFAHLQQQAQLVRRVSEQAFAQARTKLSLTAIPELNDWLIDRAEHYGFIPRWRGLRLVAADASTMRFGLRASHVSRAALADQILFGLYLPGAELMLATSLHSVRGRGERQMLFENLHHLSNADLLLLDRGYPASWLVAVLNQMTLSFCMRVDHSGFKCVRAFLRSGRAEAIVTLPPPNRTDALAYEVDRKPQTVRLVRNVSSTGNVRVLMTNLIDSESFPAACFGELYHRRWSIEEAFKRLKHRLSLEHVSGLSQQAVVQDVSAKVLCDNLQALTAAAAHKDSGLPDSTRINRAYVHTALKPLLPVLLIGTRAGKLLRGLLELVAQRTYRHREGRSNPRSSGQKPHKPMTQKQC